MQGIKKKDIYLGFLVVAIIVGMMYAYNRDHMDWRARPKKV